MGLFSWLSGGDRMDDARRVLLEGADEKIRAGVDEFAVEIRGGDFGSPWTNNVDSRLLDYVTQGLDQRGLVILGVDNGPNADSVWIRVKNPVAAASAPTAAAPDQEAHLQMKDGRKFPLGMSPGRAEQILAEATAAGDEFVSFTLKDGLVNTQLLSEVDGIGAGYALQITPSDT